MVAALTTDTLVDEVKDQALLPTADGRLTTAQILRLGDRVMRTVVSDVVISSRGGWWLTVAGTDTTIVAGTATYALPARALGESTASLVIVDSGGAEWEAPEIPMGEAQRYRKARGPWESPYAFVWRDDRVELLPTPTAGGYSLRIYVPRRPSRLVAVSSCALVSSTGATTITTSATVPTAWASSETIDVISGVNGRPRGEDLAGTSIATTNVTISAGVPSGTAAGDYVCLDGTTCVPPLSEAVWPVLVDGLTLEVLRALDEPTEAAETRLRESVARARNLSEPRGRGAARKIIARNHPLRAGAR